MSQHGQNQSESHGAREWYASGLQFECTQCGNCCTGPPGVVRFSAAEGRAMALAMGMTERQFHEHFTRKVDGQRSLRERETEHGFDCIFLDRTSQPGRALCMVYKARPTQCRTWPFWPELLRSQRSWELAKRNTPCPGMNTGAVVPISEIRIRRDEAANAESS